VPSASSSAPSPSRGRADIKRFIAICALALGASLAAAPGALAHANLASSEPSSGARLESAPTSVVLHFTEQPELSLSDIQVLASDGTRVDTGSVKAGDQPRSLQIGVKITAKGTYTVAWHCISKVDGHATAGSFAFGVGVNPAAPTAKAAKGPGPNPLEMAGRFGFIIGVIGLFGGALVALAAYPQARPKLRAFVGWATLVGIAGVVILAFAQHGATHAPWSALFKVPVGRALIERGALLVAALVVIGIGASAVTYGLVLLLGAAAMVADVLAGHAAATNSWIGGPALQITAQVIHFASAAVWMGGLAAVLVAIRGTHTDEKADAVLRYSRFAAVCLFAVAATGLYRAIGAIGSWFGLFHSGYGYLVIAKTVLLAMLAALGARQRFWNLDKIRTTLAGLRRIGTGELGVALAIFIATAVLLGLSPPPPANSLNAPLVADGTDLGHTVTAHLAVTPGQAGINTFAVTLKSQERPNTVALRFGFESGGAIGPSTLQLRRHGGAWTASASNLSIEGRWSVTVVVQGATTSAEVPLEVATHCEVQPIQGPNNLTLYNQTLAGGASDSMYLDPGRTGHNEVHFTFFDAKGNELAIPATPTITAWRPNHAARGLAVRRFSAGHFIASARLGRGNWRFEAEAAPKGTSQPLRACFEQTI
jgi:methionine-rich copper-binding protein CopC/putative copper export protein